MGLYDREYYREETKGLHLGGQWSMVTTLIVINVAIFIVDQFTPAIQSVHGPVGLRWLSDFLSAPPDVLVRPLQWWRLLTCGFAHDPMSVGHVGWNMFGLFLFGRDLEHRYGRTEFLRFYLVAIVISSIAHAAFMYFHTPPEEMKLLAQANFQRFLGASGAVMAVVALCAFNYPTRRLLLWLVVPIPMWLLALLYVAGDVSGIARDPDGGVAYAAHLGGAAFGALYFQFNWHISSYWPDFSGMWKGVRSTVKVGARPKLKIHHPEAEGYEPADEAAVDRVLQKISREGEASLSEDERRILEEASRRYQRRRK